MSEDPKNEGASSLWTTPVAASSEPLKEAAIDRSVSVQKLREAVAAARQRASAFAGGWGLSPATEGLLRRSF